MQRSAKRERIEAHPSVDGKWLYAPAHRVLDFLTGEVSERPYPARVFGLPKTHSLSHATATEPGHLSFLVCIFGFLRGTRLTEAEMGFLDAAPIRTEELTDFAFFGHGECRALAYADKFWKSRGAEAAGGLSGAIDVLAWSRNPRLLDIERLNLAYLAADASADRGQDQAAWDRRELPCSGPQQEFTIRTSSLYLELRWR